MEKVKFKCIGLCDKEFEAGNWTCLPGVSHTVKEKTYYMADAPHCDFQRDPLGKAFRLARTSLHAIPEREIRNGLDIRKEGAPPIVFVSGQYTTSNPEEQFYLEHGTAAKSLCPYEKWFDVYHTPQQKQNIRDGQLKDRERILDEKATRLEKENNDLLSRIQKQKKPDHVTA